MKNLILIFMVVCCSAPKKSSAKIFRSTTNQELNAEERKLLIQILAASLKRFETTTQNLTEEQLRFKAKKINGQLQNVLSMSPWQKFIFLK